MLDRSDSSLLVAREDVEMTAIKLPAGLATRLWDNSCLWSILSETTVKMILTSNGILSFLLTAEEEHLRADRMP
jgi:hypothetical protein